APSLSIAPLTVSSPISSVPMLPLPAPAASAASPLAPAPPVTDTRTAAVHPSEPNDSVQPQVSAVGDPSGQSAPTVTPAPEPEPDPEPDEEVSIPRHRGGDFVLRQFDSSEEEEEEEDAGEEGPVEAENKQAPQLDDHPQVAPL